MCVCMESVCIIIHMYSRWKKCTHTYIHTWIGQFGHLFPCHVSVANRMIPVVRNRKEIGAVQTDVEIEVLGNNVVEQLGQQFQQDSSPTGTGG